jgi:hypothetical protein
VRKLIDMSIDFGGSSTKIVASHEGQLICFSIAPEVISIINDLAEMVGNYNYGLVQHLWVSSLAGEAYAVGELARRHYHATIPLVQPKAKYIVVRTMAAISVIAHRFKLSSCSLNLRCLLPAAEFDRESQSRLATALSEALKEFNCPIGKVRCRLKNFCALPEGMGLVSHFVNFSQNYFGDQDIACVMFGHRNTSLFLLSGGKPNMFRSSNLGFIRAIEFAKVNQVSVLEGRELVSPAAIAKYWTANESWLIENWPATAKALVLGGGPISTIKNEAVSFFSGLLPGTPPKNIPGIFIDGGFPAEDQDSGGFGWPKDIELSTQARLVFADVYCDWKCAQNQ